MLRRQLLAYQQQEDESQQQQRESSPVQLDDTQAPQPADAPTPPNTPHSPYLSRAGSTWESGSFKGWFRIHPVVADVLAVAATASDRRETYRTTRAQLQRYKNRFGFFRIHSDRKPMKTRILSDRMNCYKKNKNSLLSADQRSTRRAEDFRAAIGLLIWLLGCLVVTLLA
jgi:hypothetical protein